MNEFLPVATDLPTHPTAKPRLSILHLLVWTAISAAMMALLKLLGWTANKSFQFEDGYAIGFSIYSGAAVGGALMWAARCWRRQSFPTEPGEWLLVIQGCAVLLISSIAALSVSRWNKDWAYAVIWGLVFTIGLLPVIFCRQGRVWFCFFLLLASMYAIPLAVVLLDATSVLVSALVWMFAASPLIILAGIGTDWWYGVRRGWVHWVGIATALLFVSFHIAFVIIMTISGEFVINGGIMIF